MRTTRDGARPGGDELPPAPSNFRGTAHTLGSGDVPSRIIEDPNASFRGPAPRVERLLHFWSNGFSVDDGELYDTSDPENARILEMIRSGRAPLDIMDVSQDQEVDVKVEPHEGPYVAPKKKATPFSGSGQRLGSPIPGVLASSSASLSSAPSMSIPSSSAASARTATGDSSAAGVSLDDSQPSVSIQIRLGDGTRLISRFNPSHTINDIYDFVNASNASSAGRAYVLMTTFPSNELSERATTIGDTEELKKGGAIVQKWL